MKTNLINTPQGVIAVVGEPPTSNDWYFSEELNMVFEVPYGQEFICSVHQKVIASTFGVGKKLEFESNEYLYDEDTYKAVIDDAIGKPYEYTEIKTSIIVKL